LSKLSNKLISTNNRLYYVLGTASVNSGYNVDELKKMWRLADAVLKNGNKYYICNEIINAEFKVIK
tara:strand:- start:1432 stop:1629 length:198 start_codon:yes stop_codon:yes gene_type:complete